MAKVRTTVTLDEEVMRLVEESPRRDLGLETLEKLWSRNTLPEEDVIQLAREAQHSTRMRRAGLGIPVMTTFSRWRKALRPMSYLVTKTYWLSNTIFRFTPRPNS